MPVPASRTRAVSSSSITSTQEVLPPYFVVYGPGVGTEPRHPQIFRRIDTRDLTTPEHHDHADELVRVRKKGECADLDLSLDSVGARDDVPKVRGAALVEGDA